MKKRRILIGVVILLISSLFICLFLNYKENKEKIKIEENSNSNISYLYKIDKQKELYDINVFNDYYTITNENTLYVYDYDNNYICKVNTDSYYIREFGNYFLIDSKGIYNKNCELLMEDDFYHVYGLNSDYLIKNNELYNMDLELKYTLDFKVEEAYIINDNYMYVDYGNKNNIILDINSFEVFDKNITRIDDYFGSKYFIVNKENNRIVYSKNGEVLLSNLTYGMYYGSLNNENYYFTNGEIYKNKDKINDKYYIDEDSCYNSFKIKDINGNILYDKCINNFEIFGDNIIFSEKNEMLSKSKIVEFDYYDIVGDYLLVVKNDDVTHYDYYDKEGNTIDEYYNLLYINSNLYTAIYNDKYVLLDKNLKVLAESDKYIYCNNYGYCSLRSNKGAYQLYKNGKLYSTNKYYALLINDDCIIGNSLLNTYIYKFGEERKDIYLKEEIDIDIESVIQEYGLEDIKEDIYKHKDLFKKYAYIVINNDNLLDYKKEVLNMFKIISEKYKYMNEYNLLDKLMQLNISYSELEDGVGGLYTSLYSSIQLIEDSKDYLYHELLHFIDDTTETFVKSELLKCGSEYVVSKTFDGELRNCDSLVNISTNFITETGAELYSAKYYTNGVDSYMEGVDFLQAFEIIYGEEKLDEWFYKDDTYFIKYWFDLGYSYEEVEEIFKYLNDTTKIYFTYDSKTFLTDLLIDVYKKEVKNNFLSDPVFKYHLKFFIGYSDISESKYYEELKDILLMTCDDAVCEDVRNIIGDYSYVFSPGSIIYKSGKPYISWYVRNDSEEGTLLIDYDFLNDKVISTKYKKNE